MEEERENKREKRERRRRRQDRPGDVAIGMQTEG